MKKMTAGQEIAREVESSSRKTGPGLRFGMPDLC